MRLQLGIGLFTLTFVALAEPSTAVASVPLPPPELHCTGLTGECAIDNTPQDFLSCECTDGTSDGFVGGSTWASYSNLELLAQCEQELASLCSVPPPPPPPPPPPVLECISRLGECTITASPVDHLECACSDGASFVVSGGNEWASLSDEELLMVCEQELATGCAIAGETSDTGDSDGGSDTGDSDGGNDTGDSHGGSDTSGASDSSEPGDSGSDGDGGASEGSATGDPDPTTTGNDPTSGASEGGEGETSDGDGGADDDGRGCSIAPRSASNGLALALLGLLAGGRRRRRTG